MKHDEANVVVKDVFTRDEIDRIYKAVQNNSGGDFIKVHAQANTFIELPQDIIDKVTKLSKEISGNDNLVLQEYCHARYNNVTSNCGKYHYKPSLFPHYDETFKEARFTFDYQINGNVEWPLVVEPDQEFALHNNEALTFSGTHQIHWRKPQEFSDDQFVEMVFFHFSDPTSGPKSPELNVIMNQKAEEYKKVFYANGGFTNDASD
jgi:hypothetical protein